jgi:hypothetical protein
MARKRRAPTRMVSISLELPRRIVEKLDKRCGGPSGGSGRAGGRAHYIRKLVYQAVGEPIGTGRAEWTRQAHTDFMEMADMTRLDQLSDRNKVILSRILTLREAGKTLAQIARVLQDEKFPTRSGKPWRRGAVDHFLRKLLPQEDAEAPPAD